jgi:hypothetical protein
MGAFDDLIPKAKELAQSDAPPVSAPGGPFGDLMPKPADKPLSERWSGSVLPLSEGPRGGVQFDSNAGILGGLKRAFTTPGDVYAGRVDPMSQEGVGRALEMASVFSPMNPAIRSGGFAIPGVKQGMVPAKVEPPTAEALKAAASKGYDAVRDMGVQYSTDAVTRHIGGLRAGLEQDGFLGELAPQTFAIISKFDNPPPGSVVTSAGLEAARRAAGKAARSNDPTEREAARRLIQGLDQFVESADPNSVVAGPAAAAGEALTAARGNYAAASRSGKLQGVEERAELNAAKANSGFNTDNAVRQRADAIVSKRKEAAGFTPDEIEALKEIIRGSKARNTLRTVGNLAGGGGGLGAAVSGAIGGAAGGALGGPGGVAIGAAVPLAGMGAKGIANRMALSELGKLDAATRARSPLYQEMLGQPPMVMDRRIPPALQVLGAGSLAALGQPSSPQALEEAYRRLLAEGGA